MNPDSDEMAEVVLQPGGIMGDTLCERCGTKFEVDNYCSNGHMKPTPKPASGEWANTEQGSEYFRAQASEQDNPTTTGEWTEQSVADVYTALGTLSFRTIANAHNAALASAKPVAGEWTVARLTELIGNDRSIAALSHLADAINAALAAEQESHAKTAKQFVDMKAYADATEQQLAAEKEVGHNQAVTLGQHIARLEDQLAAEKAKVKP